MQTQRIALFIDGENISAKYAERIFYETRTMGDLVSVKCMGCRKTHPHAHGQTLPRGLNN